ncbi:hypothetical protein E2C01_023605 [Portunus trituberculatus]|uniref:Uncharacterized protein n=1 Tax=Portunus trituberculatus TaxID=210409 RepID=A0A5B7EBK3_PORTR|nr:hypothetical protein [Portunus trituberculatus]
MNKTDNTIFIITPFRSYVMSQIVHFVILGDRDDYDDDGDDYDDDDDNNDDGDDYDNDDNDDDDDDDNDDDDDLAYIAIGAPDGVNGGQIRKYGASQAASGKTCLLRPSSPQLASAQGGRGQSALTVNRRAEREVHNA